jgi:SAM-dependent methyltransferase
MWRSLAEPPAANHLPLPLLEGLEDAYPGLGQHIRDVASCFRVPLGVFRERFAEALEALGAHEASAACKEWEELGFLPRLYLTRDEQVATLWNSTLFQIFLKDVMHFYPPETLNVADHLPPPCESVREVWSRSHPRLLEDPYWKIVLFVVLPELYLEPFLPTPRNGRLLGCDLGCGWGRAVLSLRNYQHRRIYCCDMAPQNLRLLRRLASRAGVGEHILPLHSNITDLPFADDSIDFFLSFDIFEHLTNQSIEKVLQEILRCARPGAVLYAEIPLHSLCPTVTHIQDFSKERVVELFEGFPGGNRCFVLRRFDPFLPSHFSFSIETA